MLMKAYSDFEDGTLKGKEGGYQIDLRNIREKDVEEWSKEELKLVIYALIQQLSTLLNRKSLGVPPVYRPEVGSILDSDDIINRSRSFCCLF